jgi:hypothetical protein
MANHLKKYYIQFADDLDLSLIPVKQLSSIGTWSRRSAQIYEGTSSSSAKEIENYIIGTCGIRPSRFKVIRDEDAIFLQR